MQPKKQPFNLEVMQLTPNRLRALRAVKVPDIYDGVTKNFHEDGLYSIAIFGQPGTDERNKRFSYIDLKLEIFHPFVYHTLTRLKDLYGGIMRGNRYAIWSSKEKDFLPSDELEGETGYAFFLEHWRDIKFKSTGSEERDFRIQFIEKVKDRALTNKWMVLPAGLREVQIEDDKISEDELNDLYRRVLSISNAIMAVDGDELNPIFNKARFSLQEAVFDIYQAIDKILTGKKGLIQAKWGSRRVFYGTRNVLSSLDLGIEDLEAPNALSPTDTVVGLYQTLKGAMPKTVFYLTHSFISKIFSSGDQTVPLINRKTLKTEWVNVTAETFDRWTSPEGIENVVNYYANASIRHKPVTVEGKYLALIYNDGESFRVLDAGEYETLDSERRVHCSPITLAEALYLVGYQHWNNLKCQVVRYPVTGINSVYVSTVYLKTTVTGQRLEEVDADFQPIGEDHVAYEFPKRDVAFFDTTAVNSGRLAGLGADFDGDTCSVNYILSDQANAEIEEFFNSPRGYLDPTGGLYFTGTDTIDWGLRGLTFGHDV